MSGSERRPARNWPLSHLCALLALVAALGASLAPVPVRAQLPGISVPTAPPPGAGGIQQEGIFTTAPIALDGQTLFPIAQLSSPTSASALTLRQNTIESALDQVLATKGVGGEQGTEYDPQTVEVNIKRLNDQDILTVKDAHHAAGLPIVTVTSADAQYNVLTPDEVAAQWREILQSALVAALRRREPGLEQRRIRDLLVAVAILLVISVLISLGASALRRRAAALEQLRAEREAGLHAPEAQPSGQEAEAHVRRRRFLALALRASDPAQRAAFFRAIADSIWWCVALLWLISASYGFSLFAQTVTVGRTIVGIAGIWVGVGLLNRISDAMITNVARVWQARGDESAEARARAKLRAPTIARAFSGAKAFLLVFLAVLATLTRIGVPVESVVTIGGVTAVAVSLAAQNLLRDFLTGFLVLFEDQYAVGDYITANGMTGLVENLTLRIVQLRDASGNFVTIPHSAVTAIVNQSRNWSRVDFRVSIDPAADSVRAMELIREAVDEMRKDARWKDVIIAPIEWIGIDQFSRDGVVIRASVRTAPLQQFTVRRELNARVQTKFAEAKIAYGAPIA